jgi:hypothetical protein
MAPEFFGIEGITEDDRAYGGSRFAEVRDASSPIRINEYGAAPANLRCRSTT